MHSADKLAKMRTKFHIIQAKLIMSVWCFTVQWELQSDQCTVYRAGHGSELITNFAIM